MSLKEAEELVKVRYAKEPPAFLAPARVPSRPRPQACRPSLRPYFISPGALKEYSAGPLVRNTYLS